MHQQCRSNPSGAKLTGQRLGPAVLGTKESGEPSDDHVSQKRRAGMAGQHSIRLGRRDTRVSQAH
jgi:hypothetical protein